MGRILLAGFVVLLSAIASAAQLTAESVRRILVDQAGFTDAEVDRADGGDVVVKVIGAGSKQDIAIIGVVRIDNVKMTDLAGFRQSLDQKSSKSVASGGDLSMPPVIGDLVEVRVDERDLKELANCRPGNCDLNLSVETIRTLQEIEPSKLKSKFLDAVFERATTYWAEGDRGLRPYGNRKEPLDVGAALTRALNESLFLGEASPELRDYLQRFPESELAGVRNELRWSQLDFGLNPAIVLTHTVAYSSKSGAQIVVNKQFYGSRYLDASISIAYLLPVAEASSYLVFSDFSRTDAIAGPLGSVARKLVVNEAIERTTEMIEKAELRLLSTSKAGRTTTEPPPDGGYFEEAAIISVSIVALAAVFWFITRRSRLFQ